MIFEMTDEMRKHLEIVAGEMYLIDDNPELLKMNEEYREEYGIDLFKKNRKKNDKDTAHESVKC